MRPCHAVAFVFAFASPVLSVGMRPGFAADLLPVDASMNAWMLLALGASFLTVALVSWALIGMLARTPVTRPAAADVLRLPWSWRVCRPLLLRVAPALSGFIGVSTRERLRRTLARAGFDGALSPDQFVAAQVLLATMAAICMLLVLPMGSGISLPGSALAALIGAALPRIAVRERCALRERAVLRQLPHDLDIVTLSVEAGLTLGAALAHAVSHGPAGPLRDEWQRVLRDVHAGQSRHEALRAMAARLALPAVTNVVATLIAAERQGASLAPILRAQAEQRRNERFLRAERLAMQAPVKMLLPLVLFIFPGSFVIVFFPVAQRLFAEGVL